MPQFKAICIDQATNKEKPEQIGLMRAIYGQANRVIVWLGPAEKGTDEALERIRLAAEDMSLEQGPPSQTTTPTKLSRKAHQATILKLLQRPWIERIWVRNP
ncbi:hypothetical protein BBP40_011982 [Aspergillus hancockii]|nr:hypothetical protein BBP40_011982 [Aspergillus hancockii]